MFPRIKGNWYISHHFQYKRKPWLIWSEWYNKDTVCILSLNFFKSFGMIENGGKAKNLRKLQSIVNELTPEASGSNL